MPYYECYGFVRRSKSVFSLSGDGIPAAMVKADVGADGSFTLDEKFYVEFPEGYRSHQIRLEGGDCSTDSFCYPSV